ncbi:hypothetical protein BaRGS_00021627 [Batillaria attramentaria]|uniref:AB hydrolase-1 domain-containing protein n=1 Tax=Batillaria attramentaria TaxID=370345 RepID=A0ABD0KJG3_9CAEN
METLCSSDCDLRLCRNSSHGFAVSQHCICHGVFNSTSTPSQVTYILAAAFYFSDLKNPREAGLEAARQVDLKLPTGETLGLWHILPESAIEEKNPISEEKYESQLASGSPIFIYLHGNGGTRGQSTRVFTYSVLRGQGWHVITLDYRGYGDSDGEATEINMVEDAVSVYRWTKNKAGTSPVFLWGHSLDEAPAGIVLEGAFSNLNDQVDAYLLTMPYRPFPFLMWIFHAALSRMKVNFKTDQHITKVQCPILMLHAEDDLVVPIDLAQKLFKTIMTAHSSDQPQTVLHTFPGSKGYGHNLMNRDPELGDIVRKFIQDSTKPKPAG